MVLSRPTDAKIALVDDGTASAGTEMTNCLSFDARARVWRSKCNEKLSQRVADNFLYQETHRVCTRALLKAQRDLLKGLLSEKMLVHLT